MSEAKGLMTQGAIWKKILLFSLPLLLGNVFQQLYNTVDSVIVGNYAGGAGKASVPSIIMAANMCGVRILWLSILMPIFNSIIVVYLAFSVTWLTTGLCLIWYCRHSHWLEQLESV